MAEFTLKKRIKIFIGVIVIKTVARILWSTCRVEAVLGEEHVLKLIENNKTFIPCCWHQLLLFGAYYMVKLKKLGANIGFLISPSADGELGARILGSWGLGVIRGSATRTGAQAIQALYTAVKKQGVSPVNAPDGPRGPVFELKIGPVLLAQLTQAPIIPFAYAADKSWHLKSWDQFLIPKPFSKITIVVGEPIYVAKKLSKEAQEQTRQQAEKALNEVMRKAQQRYK